MTKNDAVKFNVYALVQDTNSLPAMETALAEAIAHQMITNGFVRLTRTREPGLTEFIRVTAEICAVPFEDE